MKEGRRGHFLHPCRVSAFISGLAGRAIFCVPYLSVSALHTCLIPFSLGLILFHLDLFLVPASGIKNTEYCPADYPRPAPRRNAPRSPFSFRILLAAPHSIVMRWQIFDDGLIGELYNEYLRVNFTGIIITFMKVLKIPLMHILEENFTHMRFVLCLLSCNLLSARRPSHMKPLVGKLRGMREVCGV